MNINKNFAWTTLFVKRLEKLGVRDVCISPGSRNTPLTLAFAASKKIKQHIFIDERASAFFALGIAKATGKLVAIVTTSGTATAEIYPAIIEAYLTRVPLIICSADRPEYLRNTGANQTINQDNLYKNHIRFFYDFRLPKLSKSRLQTLMRITEKAYFISSEKDRGPVHLNFPFEKPLEPGIKDSEMEEELFNEIVNSVIINSIKKKNKINKNFIEEVVNTRKTLILLGAVENRKEEKLVISFAEKLKAPVIADGISSARFLKRNENVISIAASVFKTGVPEKFDPELIIQFGKAPTTNALLSFFETTSAKKILINEFGDAHDPSRSFTKLIKTNITDFTNELTAAIKERKIKRDAAYLSLWKNAEEKISNFKREFLAGTEESFEGKIIAGLFEALPEKSNLFIGNSTPPRDADVFSGKNRKETKVYSNRGASGIDGIISTAGGIATKSKEPTFLLIGDVSFLYGISALGTLSRKGIDLTVILLNNNGGGIFTMLPVYNEKKYFNKYFKTPTNSDFRKLTEAFGCGYFNVENIPDLKLKLAQSLKKGGVNVLELKTDAYYSKNCREKYYSKVSEILND